MTSLEGPPVVRIVHTARKFLWNEGCGVAESTSL